jgi:CrcB protein
MNPFCFITGLALAGALGTLARYGVGAASATTFGTSYPYGTFFVNVFGSFLFGLLVGFPRISPAWQIILLTGFLGGFTTFSAFAFENYKLLEQQRYIAFFVHVAGQNVLGIVAVLAGFLLASSLFGKVG